MESIKKRLDILEASIDADKENKPIVETINTLNNHLNVFINRDPKLVKLFNNLNNSKIQFYYDENLRNDIDENELEIRRQFVFANLERIEKLANNLSVLQSIEKPELDGVAITPLKKSNDIIKQFNELQKLEIKYNELLIRSIHLLQNFLNLNNSINKFVRQLKLDKRT